MDSPFKQTFIINLKRRHDKRNFMESQLAVLDSWGININPIFFDAVDGQNKEMLNRRKYNVIKNFIFAEKAITTAEVGCSLSHYGVWETIVDGVESGKYQTNDWFIVLEDDAIFQDNFKDLSSWLSEVDSFDFVYLRRGPTNTTKVTKHLTRVGLCFSLEGYVLTYSGAKKLVNGGLLDNLILADLYVPIMRGCAAWGHERHFNRSQILNTYSVEPFVLSSNDASRLESDIFFSTPYDINQDYVFNGVKFECVCLYSNDAGNSVDRFINTCSIYSIPVKSIYYDDEESRDRVRELANLADDSAKFEELLKYADTLDDNKVVLVCMADTDGHVGVLPMTSARDIMDNFLAKTSSDKNKILFGATNCFLVWSSYLKQFVDEYLESDVNFSTYLLNHTNVVLDSGIFETINDNLELSEINANWRVKNRIKNHHPLIIISTGHNLHHRERSRIRLNYFENYTGICANKKVNFPRSRRIYSDDKPSIYVSCLLKSMTDYDRCLKEFTLLNYPQDKLHIVYNVVDNNNEADLRNTDMVKFLSMNCDYYFYWDSSISITNPDIFTELLSYNKQIISPLIKGSGVYSNFWGDIKNDGSYQRSIDYLSIFNGEHVGCFNVPYISGVYLMSRSVLSNLPNLFIDNDDEDLDMRICYNLRINNYFMYVTNEVQYGYYY